jgi:hypothetical protein
MRTNNIEKIRLKVFLKAGPKDFDPGVYGEKNSRIDPILLEEVRLETGTVEVLKLKGPTAPVIFAPVFKTKPEQTLTSLVVTSNLDLEEETGIPPVVEKPKENKPVLKVRKRK